MYINRFAVVDRNDPKFAGAGAHAQVAAVEIPIDIGPFRRTAAAVDSMKNNASAQPGQPMAEMCIGLGRTGRVRPHVVAYKPADRQLIQPKCAQRAYGVEIDFSDRLIVQTSSWQGLAVKAQIAPIGSVESKLIVGLFVVLDITSAKREPYARRCCRPLDSQQSLRNLELVEFMCIAA